MSKKIEITIENGKINWICLAADCPKPCCGPFESLSPDLVSVVTGANDDDIILTPEDMVRNSKNISLENIVSKGREHFLRLTSDGTCSLLENNLCTVHETKPLLCIAYPFLFDTFKGLCVDSSCPGFGKGNTKLEEFKLQIEALIRLQEHYVKQSMDMLSSEMKKGNKGT